MNLQITKIKKAFTHFVGRYHVVLFVVIILGGLGIIILLLNNIIITSSDSSGYTPNTKSANFDQATIDRIKQLKTSDDASGQLDLSNGRTNPFVE